MIQKLDGIMSADVTIHRPKGRGAGRQPARATAFVYVETRGGRELSPKAVEAIQNLMVREHDLTHDAVTVCDDHGRRYLEAGDPMGVQSNLIRAREEELSEKILEQINWVKGVGVTVQLIPSPAPAPTPTPIPAHPAPVEEPRPPNWEVVPNQPLELVEPTPSSGPAPALHPVASAAPPRPADEPVIARVWVKVPRSFYYLKALPNREPSPGDLQPIVTRTETLIRTAVAHAIPPGQLSEPVVIDTIPDDVPVGRPLIVSDVPESRRVISWWVPAGVGGGLMAALLLIGVRLRATRRPVARPASAASRCRFRKGRGLGGRTEHRGEGPRADPAQPRGRRGRPAPLDRTGRTLAMTRLEPPARRRGQGLGRAGPPSPTTRPPTSPSRPRSARPPSYWSAWSSRWPRNCSPSSPARPSRR